MCRMLLRFSLAMLSCLLASCGGGAVRVQGPASLLPNLLPALPVLDTLRGVRAAQLPADVTAPLLESDTSAIGSNLALAPPPGGMAWAVFRILPPVPEVVSVAAGGDDGLYLLVADFGAGSWARATEIASGFAIASLGALSNPLSPDGYVYCAVVAPAGVPGQLSSLALNHDGPANVYYVAPPADGGNDSNPGSFAEPWATLQHAADTVGPDSIVNVSAGSYLPFTLMSSGAQGAPIIFRSSGGAVIDATGESFGVQLGQASWVTIDGFAIQNSGGSGIEASGGAGTALSITLRNNYITSSANDGIYLDLADGAVIEGNIIENSGGTGIALTNDCDQAVIRGNNIYGSSNSGIYVATNIVAVGSSEGVQIAGNTVYSNNTLGLGAGIHLNGVVDSTVSNNQVYSNKVGLLLASDGGVVCTGNTMVNNTVFQKLGDGECLLLRSGCIANRLFNNILFHDDPSVFALSFENGTLEDFLCDYNVMTDSIESAGSNLPFEMWQSIYHYDLNGQLGTAAATFVDPVIPDLHLLPTAGAVDAALADYAPANDLDGTPRPQGASPDCGCYELVP